MNKKLILTISLVVALFGVDSKLGYSAQDPFYWQDEMDLYEGNGWACDYYKPDGVTRNLPPQTNSGWIVCFIQIGTTYGANVIGGLASNQIGLTGTSVPIMQRRVISSWTNSPFIYFHNPPQGDITASLTSKLNRFIPKPDFTTTNSWKLIGDAKKGTVSLNNKELKHLFYELEMNEVTLTRHGKNFSSKSALIEYLNDSDFFSKFGFSQEEKDNSLTYLFSQLENEKKSKKYYYLTILPEEYVAKISTLRVEPKPKKILRNYFAVYPTDVPVKIEGNFKFPKNQNAYGSSFVVKETGEFLLSSDMTVFFK